MEMKQVVEKQLALDYDCTLEEIQSDDNIFKLYKRNDGARISSEEAPMLKIAVYGGKMLVMASKEIFDWCALNLNICGSEWISEPQNLIFLDAKLKTLGHKLAKTTHVYIPGSDKPADKMEVPFDLVYYAGAGLEQFREDDRFCEALMFDPIVPDIMAVCAIKEDKILGMAGVSADSPTMWQVGVDVTEEGQGQGIGSYLVAAIKDKVLEQGIIPYYCTVESHILSQRAAIGAGFVPTFYEMFSEKTV